MKAYPFLHKHPTSGETTISEGMDLRDYFAAKFMQGFESRKDLDDITPIDKAVRCYKIADAMMQARKQGGFR